MKLAFSAWGMPKLPVDEQIARVKAAGFAGIELICIAGSSTDVIHLDPAEQRRIRRLLDDTGVVLTAIAGSADTMAEDAELRATNLMRLQRGVDLAAALAGPSGPAPLVIMAYGQPERYEQDRLRIAEQFSALAEMAQRQGVTLALEAHVGQAIDTPERAVWLIEQVGQASFKLNLDTSHFDVMGLTIAQSVRPLLPYAVHTHVKDQRGRYPNHEFLTPGDGDYDYGTYLQELLAGGYDGFITAEISVMVQRKPGYDVGRAIAQSHAVLSRALEAVQQPGLAEQPIARARP